MLFRPDVLPDEAGAVREARVPGARGKLVPSARGRKAYSCMNFMHRASSGFMKIFKILMCIYIFTYVLFD